MKRYTISVEVEETIIEEKELDMDPYMGKRYGQREVALPKRVVFEQTVEELNLPELMAVINGFKLK